MVARFTDIREDGRHLVAVTAVCPFCLRPAVVREVPAEAFQQWLDGAFIQDVLPGLSPADREILVSGTHDECWRRAFPPDEDEA